jgi:beta-N-acetylhexosaminidase
MRGGNRRSRHLRWLADAVLHPGFEGTVPPAWLLRRVESGLGGVALFSRNIRSWEQVAALTATLRQVNPNITVAVDEEAGDVTRLEALTGSTRPGAYALGVVDDMELTEAVAEDLGWALREGGITLNYAPDADVNSDRNNPVIGVRSFGSDSSLVARHVEAWIRGQQRAGVAACAKHFPGHGNTGVDSHHVAPVVMASRAELEARDLYPFRVAIGAGVRAVMTGHVVVPAIDADLPATLSPAVLTGLLRNELGFTGLAITDGIEMGAATSHFGLAGASVRALAAGADTICVGGENADEATAALLRDAIADAVAGGDLPEERLAEAAGRNAELARWSAEQAGRRRPQLDEAIGMVAARRALRVAASSGTTLPLRRPPHVVEFHGEVNIAMGEDTPSGLGYLLAEVLPGTTATQLGRAHVDDGGDWYQDVLATAGTRPLVVVVRDVHRYDWMSGALHRLRSARTDCIVVETGLAGEPSGAVYLSTHGGSLACRQAAVEVLVGSAPVPLAA